VLQTCTPQVLQAKHAVCKAGRGTNLLLCSPRVERNALLLQDPCSISRQLAHVLGNRVKLCAAKHTMQLSSEFQQV
jgi:hypothetical protein